MGEEGGEMCTLHGDEASECLLSDNGPNTKPYSNERNLNVESMYDYGSRCGFWRLHRLFTSRKVPVTVWAVGMALERNMEVVGAIKQQEDWEVSSHGYRWWDYKDVDEDIEREHIQRSIEIHKNLFGKCPVGLYQGKPSENTRRLAVEENTFLYDSDAYNDDLPYWTMDFSGDKNNKDNKKPHLIIPYTLVENDMLFTAPNGWSQPDDFLNHLKRTLDYLILEGREGQPKMMSVGLHCRLSRPARVAALTEFVDYAKSYGREVWITTRESIANHWYENHMPRGCGNPIIAGVHLNTSPQPQNYNSGGYMGGYLGGYMGGGGGDNLAPASNGYGGGGPSPPKSSSESTKKKFSFLGNLTASRDSQEYKDSLRTKKLSKQYSSSDQVEDVI